MIYAPVQENGHSRTKPWAEKMRDLGTHFMNTRLLSFDMDRAEMF